MKIKYSSNGELSVEGAQIEMELLSDKIDNFITSEKESICIELEMDYDPSPYERVLNKLIFSRAIESNVHVTDNTLTFSGQNEFFESISSNLPYGVDETPYHIHYDSISFPQYLKPEAPEIVFEATH